MKLSKLIRLKICSVRAWANSTFLLSLLTVGFVGGSPPVLAAKQDFISFYVQKARDLKLSERQAWKRLLVIDQRFGGHEKSLVDSPFFFLSTTGKTDPQSELEATIIAFLGDTLIKRGEEELPVHPTCIWPARFAWLDQQLDFAAKGIQPADCPLLQKFLASAQYDKVSLVFSNYFLNNPGSLFAHTFIRMHKKNAKGQVDLLDDIVNFAAFVDDDGSLLMPLKGLFGFYYGKFAMMPYYMKIQEYNNIESRDLWEYELNLSEENIRKMVLLLWELGPTYTNYYYLNNNCAFILLALLEGGDETVQLTKDFGLYTIPADTLKVVMNQGMVRKISYRASNLSRYLARYDKLSPPEQASFRDLITFGQIKKKGAYSLLSNLNPSSQARVIDTAVEYIDFKERKVSQDKVHPYGVLRGNLLMERSKIDEAPVDIADYRGSSPPHEGHRSSRVGMGAVYSLQDKWFANLSWRPALHDIAASSEGYSAEMEIDFLNVETRVRPGRLDLYELTLLRILSLPHQKEWLDPWAWHVKLAYENLGSPLFNSKAYFVEFEGGKNFWLIPGSLSLFALLGAGTGILADGAFWIAPTLMSGIMMNLGDLRLTTEGYYRYGVKSKDEKNFQSLTNQAILSYSFATNQEGRMVAEYREGASWSFTLDFLYYY